MNFLAHAYLSFNNKEVLVGNMISDFVKGRTQYDYTDGIRKGIVLHRLIDAYTDCHPIVKEIKQVFRADYRLYSGPIVDVLLDHILSIHPDFFTPASLKSFSQATYQALEEYAAQLPSRFVFVLTYMKNENWLLNYQYKEGIERSLRGLVRRSSFLMDSNKAIEIFHEHYTFLLQESDRFLKDVKVYANQQLSLLEK